MVSDEHLQEGAEGSSKDSHGQQGMEVEVQRSVAVVVETEEQTCQEPRCVRRGCSGISLFLKKLKYLKTETVLQVLL